MFIDILFYIFSFFIIVSSLAVVLTKNPVHSVLFLIFCFFNAAALFILQGAEFLAMMLIIVYVGAIAVLFLFVVMMLNIEYTKYKKDFYKSLLFGFFIIAVLLSELFVAYYFSSLNNPQQNLKANPLIAYPINYDEGNTEQIGRILYTDFYLHFQMAGLILLVAMIGAVVLTLRKRENVKKQNIAAQVSRSKLDSIKIVKVLSNKGI